MTARNPGEDSQREIMLNPDPLDFESPKKKANPKKFQQMNSIDTVFDNISSKVPMIIEVKDSNIEESKKVE